MKIKQKCMKHTIEILNNIDNSKKVKKKILNEFTIYKMFFEIEKLKRILFEREELEVFHMIKIDMASIFEKPKTIHLDKFQSKLMDSMNPMQDRLYRLLKESI